MKKIISRNTSSRSFSIFLLAAVATITVPLFAQKKTTIKKEAPIPAISVGVEVIASGIQAPTAIVFPDHEQAWVTEQSGKIRVVKGGKLLDEPLIDLKEKMVKLNRGYEERGLLGIALHPEFKANKKIYLYYDIPSVQKSNHTGVLAEYKLSANGVKIEEVSERIILTIEEPDGNHNGGCLQFGPDGYLYVSFGDGGGQGDEHGKIGNGQDMNTWHGKILRIDINTETGYKVPKDNPFMGKENIKPEIYAYGFRNPWRFSFDKATGRLFAGDVGQSTWEEVDIVKKGGNYGWRLMEGTHCYNPDKGCEIKDMIAPITEYHHSEGVSVTGGYVYNGTKNQQIKGKYIFADWTGKGYYLKPSGNKWTRGKLFFTNIADNAKITAFGEDPSGELYMLTNTDTGPENKNGTVYRITQK
ncbi:PQQ-dependent sugar dehydrogenase [Pedobacter miscanthi]|jgi:glucose/arabinose dehydrogenase|uniref:PQQ-dependent sugar dehydrogenase n=1 Tax=Pedobacter miscanthi TaxID=2259170 RepID=UPI002931008C|nr:PQQ-dependent sugar dehydrogenase [Pedobacter miscanthi]